MTAAPRRSWKRRSDARPGELRTAALRLFATHGYGGTTIEDIAAAAAVTVGTVYRYFRDKEALLREIVESASGEPLLAAAAGPSRSIDPETDLGHLLERLWIGSRREPHVHLLRLLVAESGNSPQLIERYRTRVLEPVERELTAVLRHLGRSEQTQLTARGCLGAVLGASILAGSSSVPIPLVPQLAPLETIAALGGGSTWSRGQAAPSPPAPPSVRERPQGTARPRTPDSW